MLQLCHMWISTLSTKQLSKRNTLLDNGCLDCGCRFFWFGLQQKVRSVNFNHLDPWHG